MSETIHALAKGSDAVEEYYSFLRSPVRERRYMKQIEGTVVLLGDSIFDNAHYVKPGQSVSDHLTRLQIEHKLLAVDGSVTVQVLDQLKNVPKNATDLFVSSGGNDALIAKGQLFPQSGISMPKRRVLFSEHSTN